MSRLCFLGLLVSGFPVEPLRPGQVTAWRPLEPTELDLIVQEFSFYTSFRFQRKPRVWSVSCSPNLLSLCISVMWSDWSTSVFTPSTWTVAICGRLGKTGVRQGAPASLGGTCVELLRLVGELGLLRRHKIGNTPPKKTGDHIKMDSWLTTAPIVSALFLNQAVSRVCISLISSSPPGWSSLNIQSLKPKRR